MMGVGRLSAMRMFAAAGFVSVDERAVFGCCLPRWENSALCVNFYETASYMVRGRAQVVGAGAVVRNAECGPGAELVGPHQSWVHLGLSAMRSLTRWVRARHSKAPAAPSVLVRRVCCVKLLGRR